MLRPQNRIWSTGYSVHQQHSAAQRSITTTTLAISSARLITATQQRKPQHSCNSWIDYDYIQRLPCKPPIGSQSKSLFSALCLLLQTHPLRRRASFVWAQICSTQLYCSHTHHPQPQPATDRPTSCNDNLAHFDRHLVVLLFRLVAF